jgi:hypothetical protein
MAKKRCASARGLTSANEADANHDAHGSPAHMPPDAPGVQTGSERGGRWQVSQTHRHIQHVILDAKQGLSCVKVTIRMDLITMIDPIRPLYLNHVPNRRRQSRPTHTTAADARTRASTAVKESGGCVCHTGRCLRKIRRLRRTVVFTCLTRQKILVCGGKCTMLLEVFVIYGCYQCSSNQPQPRASARKCTSNSTTLRCGHTRTTQPTAPARARASTSSDAKPSGAKAAAEDEEDDCCAGADTAEVVASDGGASDDKTTGTADAFTTDTMAAFTRGIELTFATGIEPAANTEATRNGLRCGAMKGSCSEISSH